MKTGDLVTMLTENAAERSPAATEHGQESPPVVECQVTSTEDPESFQEEAMKTGDLVTMLTELEADTSPAATEHDIVQESPPAMVSEPDACNIPSTEVPEASPFQEWG